MTTAAGNEALGKVERAGVLSASEIKSLTKIAYGEDSASHVNIKKSTMTKLLRRMQNAECRQVQERHCLLHLLFFVLYPEFMHLTHSSECTAVFSKTML